MPTDKAREEASLERWKITREKGYWRFVFVNGMLAWGLPLFIVNTFMYARGLDARGVMVAAAIWAVAGFSLGVLVWYFSERRYLKLTANGQGADGP